MGEGRLEERPAWEKLLAAERHLLRSYKGLAQPWNDWSHLRTRGKAWATIVARLALRRKDGTAP